VLGQSPSSLAVSIASNDKNDVVYLWHGVMLTEAATRFAKPKSSLKDGGTITTPNGHIVHWATATCARGHRSDGPKANHALTFKLDHSSGAAQYQQNG
jgi:hypothetical protein